MPPSFLYDLSSIDLNKITSPIEVIRNVIPQRFEMELLTSIVHVTPDGNLAIAVKDVTLNDFWVRGHIPGRPLMPGVMMIEAAAQLCAYITMSRHPEMGFIGFAKCDEVRFRAPVVPPTKLYIIASVIELNRRRAIAKCQGINNGNLVFEATITGMPV